MEDINEEIVYETPDDIDEQILFEVERLKAEDDRVRKENLEALRQKTIEQYYRDKYIDKIHIFFALFGGLFSWVIIYATGNLNLEEMLFRILIVIAGFYVIGLWLRSYIKKNIVISDDEILASLGFEERALEYENLQKKEEAIRKLQAERIMLEQKLREQENEEVESINIDKKEQIEKTSSALESKDSRPKYEGNLNYDEEPDFSVK